MVYKNVIDLSLYFHAKRFFFYSDCHSSKNNVKCTIFSQENYFIENVVSYIM